MTASHLLTDEIVVMSEIRTQLGRRDLVLRKFRFGQFDEFLRAGLH